MNAAPRMEADRRKGNVMSTSKGKKLPTLKVVIVKLGKVVRTTELPDPRAVFIERFNAAAAKLGLVAKLA